MLAKNGADNCHKLLANALGTAFTLHIIGVCNGSAEWTGSIATFGKIFRVEAQTLFSGRLGDFKARTFLALGATTRMRYVAGFLFA